MKSSLGISLEDQWMETRGRSFRTTGRRTVFGGVLFALAALLALPACDDGADSDTDSFADALLVQELAERTFISQKVEEGGSPHDLVAGTELSLIFHENREIGAAAGCNSTGGIFHIVDNRLVIDEMATTEMGCDPSLHDQDSWYFGFLASSPTFAIEGDSLILDSGAIHIEFLDREVVQPDLDLVGPLWVVDTIIDGDSAINANWQAPATLLFGENGQVDVFSGCNKGGAPYQVNGSQIVFGTLALTEIACPDDISQQLEDAVRAVFQEIQPVAWDIEADRLSLDIEGAGLAAVADAE
jgi:heat shock protein HslJ